MSLAGGKAPYMIHLAARKILAREGLAALMPRYLPRDTDVGHRHWQKPLISKRVASVLRKEAIRTGTYGTYNTEALTGWERTWDIEMEIAKNGEGRKGIRAPKGSKRERTREQRAQRIEKAMEGMDQRIEEWREEKKSKKTKPTFEQKFKASLRGTRRGKGGP